jgi:tetratricopeptide (TPR) repeat protein
VNKPTILVLAACLALAVFFLFGKTSIPHPKMAPVSESASAQAFEIQPYIDSLTERLPIAQSLEIKSMNETVKRGDVKDQQIKVYESLGKFWNDSAKQFEPYAFYISEAAKLDNSEKKLTFAALLFLENLRAEHDPAKLKWKANTAIQLFEKAIELNPGNDDLKIGLGSSYVFGLGRAGTDPNATMQGIQQLLSVVRKDSTNMKAQFVLGVGGFVSGQYDKAIERFSKVVNAQPDNLEAVAFLADTYAASGDKAQAIKWYNISKRMVNNPAYSKQVDARIAAMK